MATQVSSSQEVELQPVTTTAAPAAETVHSQEQSEIEVEPPQDLDIQYPSGPKLWLNMASILMVFFVCGLDLTIVAVAVPSLTNQFKTVKDIGWYSAAYGLMASATCFLFSKMYTVFDMKRLFIAGIVIFESGSLICTIAPVSKVFILGRAIAGTGTSLMTAGSSTIIPHLFPNEKRALMNGFVGAAQSFGLVSAPVIGGALIDALSWRACFGINLPLGAVAVLIALFGLDDPAPHAELQLPLKAKIAHLDLIGTTLVIPSCICSLMALQWGGITYGWSDWRIILLFVISAMTIGAFSYVQYRQGEKAVLPLRILKNRNVLAGALFCGCCDGILAVTEYYISIYFQGVRGYSAVQSGLLGLPMIVGLAVASICAAVGVTRIGYYTPFMLATSVLAPIASGLLTTLKIDESKVKVPALLGFLGAAVGFGMQAPATSLMTVLSLKDIPIGLGVVRFAAGLGSSMMVATSATLFQERLKVDMAKYAPGTNATDFGSSGLSDIRKTLGPDRLKDVLLGYDKAVVQTMYLPLALTLLTIFGTVFTEIRSVKKKQA